MLGFINVVDKISAWIGHAFAWCIITMSVGVGYEVFVRYVLRDPTTWAFDLSYMMYGALFMMGGAYTLSRNGHVRGDVIYRRWSPRTQAFIEFTLYVLFFFPAVLALIFAGWDFASDSLRYREVSVMSPANVPIFHFKMVIPAAGVLLFVQGLAQLCRCILCIRTGTWPPTAADVEETEALLISQHQDETAQADSRGQRP